MRLLLKSIIFLVLTILTQIGGLVYISNDFLMKKAKVKRIPFVFLSFIFLYGLTTFLIVPPLASLFGREKIKNNDRIEPTNYATIILNRNYVVPEINQILSNTEGYLKTSGLKIKYLDAGFPFLKYFPLLPHLSHHDGRKLDLSLVYSDAHGNLSNDKKSRSGYGAFEGPSSGEHDQISICLKQGFSQYDYPKYLTFGTVNTQLLFSEDYTKDLITSLLKNKEITKIFIEPHLKNRMMLTDSRIKYHGCRAVRYDDHIHIQI